MNSWAMSTFDCSSALPISVPRPPRSGQRRRWHAGRLALGVAVRSQLHEPVRVVEVGDRQLADRDGLAGAERRDDRPSAVMLMLSTVPAAEPFWVIEEVADGDAKPVSDATLLASIEIPVSA